MSNHLTSLFSPSLPPSPLSLSLSVNHILISLVSKIVISLRKLAPHLKIYIGPWLCAQFDPENVVRTAAKNSFAVYTSLNLLKFLTYWHQHLHSFVNLLHVLILLGSN
jgi:hypothetical protein